jgi:hypothetical protein
MAKFSSPLPGPCARWRVVLAGALLAPAFVAVVPKVARAQRPDLLNDTIAPAPYRLQLRPYVTLPSTRRNIVNMTTRPGDARLYVTTEQGFIYTINEDAAGNGTASTFFDVATAVQAATGRTINALGTSQRGLQSVAFHPDFNNPASPGYGKLYTTYLQTRPTNNGSLNYLGAFHVGAGLAADGVLSEWTYNFNTSSIASNTYRELFRVEMNVYDHPIKMASFNPYARPGDEDYGLLYLTHGDSNSKPSPGDDPLHLNNALGKMLRINPLQSGGQRYTIPATNPFANSTDSSVLKEIYTYGHRNPHTFSFNKDDNGQVHILVGEIGRNNIEEINKIQAGGNYGWPDYEGTFLHTQQPDGPNAGYITDTLPLPADEASRGHIFPVAQYDHDANLSQISSGSSVSSGFVIRNGSDPQFHNKFLMANFAARPGFDLFMADFDQMLGAVDKLDPADPSRDEPSELTQAPISYLKIALDHDRNPATAPQLFDNLKLLVGSTRNDVRFGQGAFGQMYISSKVNGQIYLVTNTAALPGDFDNDGQVTADDFLIWQRDVGQQFTESPADANRDDVVDAADLAVWQANYGRQFELPPIAAATAAPEPSALGLVATAAAGWGLARRRRVLSAA